MKQSIENGDNYAICEGEKLIGAISLSVVEDGIYHIGYLYIIPEYQHRGIGTKAIQFIKKEFADWKKITLETPVDKEENVRFYTEHCGFRITERIQDGDIDLYLFIMEN